MLPHLLMRRKFQVRKRYVLRGADFNPRRVDMILPVHSVSLDSCIIHTPILNTQKMRALSTFYPVFLFEFYLSTSKYCCVF